MKPVDSERVSRAETMVVDTGDSICTCESKRARRNMSFPSPETEGCDELADVERVGGCKTASLGFSGLVLACTASSVCPIML